MPKRIAMSYPFQITSQEQYEKAYRESVDQPEEFWASVAENFQWRKKWDKVLEWNFKEPNIKWFQGGKLNITENCIDQSFENDGRKPAFIWEPNESRGKSKSDYLIIVCIKEFAR
jgi:acetyl-CoA synthetase